MTKRLRNNSINEPSQYIFQTVPDSEAGIEIAQAYYHQMFTDIFLELHGPICAYLARLVRSDDLGCDLAQETFLRVWKGLPTKQPEIPPRPWCFRIATNIAYSYLRRQKLIRWQSWDQLTQTEVTSIVGPEESICNKELIEKTLGLLPLRQRTCLLLKVYSELSDYEIAQVLGIKENSVSANLTRARQRFYTLFTRMGGDVI